MSNKTQSDSFLSGADNVYRTENYIVKQKVTLMANRSSGKVVLMSDDTYYLRTAKRDREYEFVFANRQGGIDGRRIASGVYTRTYINY